MRKRYLYILILLVLVVGGGLIARALLRGPTIQKGSYLLLDVGGQYVEAPPQDLMGRLLSRGEHTLIDLLTMIREARVDKRIKGVVLRIRPLDTGWAKVQDIRAALRDFKKSGKPLVALMEQEVTGSNKAYYLASEADRIYLGPSVTAPLNGLAAQFIFLGGVWDKLDVQMDVEKIGKYKTFGDMIADKQMTDANREMSNSLLDSLNTQFIDGLARGRHLQPAAIQTLIDQCPVSPAEYVAARLSDGTEYLQDLHAELGGKQTPLVKTKDYEQVSPQSLGLDVGPKIAVVYAVGSITTGKSGTGVEGETLGSDTVTKALEDASNDKGVRAIVFRIDSPGGSALASDLIWRATQAARQQKPVIVSMSDVAGSGGYYIAAGASQIVAEPGTLTGSIGVLVVRPTIEGLLNRLGITTQTLTRGKFAAIDDLTTPLSPEGRQKLVTEMGQVYKVFVSRVAKGRNMTPERVDAIGQGRVWTGEQAKQNGLVDQLGGFMTAIDAAKKSVGIPASQEVQLVYYPKPTSILERIANLLGAHATVALPKTLQHALRVAVPPFRSGTLLTMMRESIEIR